MAETRVPTPPATWSPNCPSAGPKPSKGPASDFSNLLFTLPPVKTVSKTNQQRTRKSLQSAISAFHVHLQKHDALHGVYKIPL